jgi:hypothetical protein
MAISYALPAPLGLKVPRRKCHVVPVSRKITFDGREVQWTEATKSIGQSARRNLEVPGMNSFTMTI